MKKILGLDLGVTSIGFAHVLESEDREQSSIEQIGVRVIPLSTDEETNFEKGKPITINADRTLKRSMRRNLDRYQLRRNNLISLLKEHHIIDEQTILAEHEKNSTHSTYELRARAASEQIAKEDFARVLLAINKKRGYKSSRKTRNEEDGQAIDGMETARRLYEEDITPGQLALQLLLNGKKQLPDFYRSDLQAELDKIWFFQAQFHPDILTPEFKKQLEGKGQRGTSAAFWTTYGFNIAENKGRREEKRIQAYTWRVRALSEVLSAEEVAYVITEINNDLNKSSGYLGAISDRSKELYFKNQTVGQYLYARLKKNPHTSLRNIVFYRQDYLDEFERIWEAQAKFHPELSPDLKKEIRDVVIFYQRKLRSQKSLVSFCEFESREVIIEKDGQRNKKRIGLKVAPKSSPLFQEFKIWQVLQNLEFKNKKSREILKPDQEAKQLLFEELNMKGNLPATTALGMLGYKPEEWDANYSVLEGNRTNKAIYDILLRVMELEGYDEYLLKPGKNDEPDIALLSATAKELKAMFISVLPSLGIDVSILDFNAELEGKDFERQASYQLWHLLYSYEEDQSVSGNEQLYKLLSDKFGFRREHATLLAGIRLTDDYGNLSAKAIRKIYPYIRENGYSQACEQAGYRHSASSLTKDEIENRPLQDQLDLIKKNSLRNPVVEKILNQLVNVVNTLIETNSKKDKDGNITHYYKFDEIRIELARELKKNAKERQEMSIANNEAKRKHDAICKILINDFGVLNPGRNDIIRYKLYEELKNNGYKDMYTNTYIPREILFSNQIDIDHIIPQARLFDDSYSNKVLCFRHNNLKKGERTAIDYIESDFGSTAADEFIERIKHLRECNKKNNEEGIGNTKFLKLQKRISEIGDGFIERDLRNSQYIARAARNMLLTITRNVVATTGEVTARLREDWGLVNLMQELNMDKYRAVGLTSMVMKKDGSYRERILNWTKRNDHRHHAIDALTVAFTKHSYIQYLNHLSARKNEAHKMHVHIFAIEAKETEQVTDDNGNKKRQFRQPLPHFREEAKRHLEQVLISYKAKNKVVTKNKNKVKTAGGIKLKTELTPRGQLHKETIYGKYRYYESKEEKISAKFDADHIQMVADPQYRMLLLQRLSEYGNDPKKAFTGKNALTKNPIYLDASRSQILPEKVKLVWLEEDYAIRKDLTPENFKDQKSIDKVIDVAVRTLLSKRLAEYGGNAKEAFSNLDKNPVWFNEEKGICIKRVRISGVKNAGALHFKKDHLGQFILDDNGQRIPVDYVSTGNNHHVAIYRDADGKLQDNIVSLFEAVERSIQGLPVIDKTLNASEGWKFLFTMKQNEYFIFPNAQTGFDPNEIDLSDPDNYPRISPNLFRVQKLSKVSYGNSSSREYAFRHHLETGVEEQKELKDITYKYIKSLPHLENIVKVRINHIGRIVKTGEY